MILHDVANNSKLIKVATSTHCTEWLFERYYHVGYVVPVPDWLKDCVGKPVVDEEEDDE